MQTYKVKDFGSRDALIETVINDHGKTMDKKEAVISGTINQLAEFRLSHNQIVWGVVVQATNYQVNNNPKVKRGKRVRSKLNGKSI